MKLIGIVYKSSSAIIFGICCLCLLFFGLSSATGWQALAIPTSSMRPNIEPGSLVLIHNVPITSLRIGDVITHVNPQKPDTTLTHRIIKITRSDNGKITLFTTKGDSNKSSDVPVPGGDVKGKVIFVTRYVGVILIYAKKPLVILPIIYIIAALLMAEEVKRMSQYLKTQQPYHLRGYGAIKQSAVHLKSRALAMCLLISAATVIFGFWQPVAALLRSNTVSLTNNYLYVPKKTSSACSAITTDNYINVESNSSQSSQSGTVTQVGKTNDGSAQTGSSANNNTTNVNINVSNSC